MTALKASVSTNGFLKPCRISVRGRYSASIVTVCANTDADVRKKQRKRKIRLQVFIVLTLKD
jgi:hypothetical protein